ncbi:MAG: alpha-D-ribose 1-methylphosphonate 5-triphosphate diphosphatase [Arenicella sp.]
MNQTVINNAQLVLKDEVIQGHLVLENGQITDVGQGNSSLHQAMDMQGDYVIPGLVELHTDNMEKYFSPRPGVDWPGVAAALAHDSQMSAAGITTVFDAVSVGYDFIGVRTDILPKIVESITKAEQQGLHKAEHFIHLRCEVSSANTAEEFAEYFDNPLVKLASLMDHSPGQRQFADVDRYRQYYQGKYGFSDRKMDNFIKEHIDNSGLNSKRNRDAIAQNCHEYNIALASHDDAKIEHVEESIAYEVSIAEFPTTLAAAKKSHENQLQVLMGAPNIIRGQSHSGNISASILAEQGFLDIISSDYYPSSMLHAAFKLAQIDNGYDLADAIRCVSWNPASAVGLKDRGQIEVGKKADFLRVAMAEDLPILKQVWKNGSRVN